MRLLPSRTLFLMPLPLLLGAASCDERVISTPIYPPRADLQVEARPVPGPEIVTSAQANGAFQVEKDSWGARGWATVGRLCRWAKRNGMTVDCPPANEGDK